MLVIVLSVLFVISVVINICLFLRPTSLPLEIPTGYVDSRKLENVQSWLDSLQADYYNLQDSKYELEDKYRKLREELDRKNDYILLEARKQHLGQYGYNFHYMYGNEVANLLESDTDEMRNGIIDYLLFQLETAYEKPIVRFRVGDQEFIKECDALREMNKQLELGNQVGPVERIERKVKLECDPNKLRNQVKKGDK